MVAFAHPYLAQIFAAEAATGVKTRRTTASKTAADTAPPLMDMLIPNLSREIASGGTRGLSVDTMSMDSGHNHLACSVNEEINISGVTI